MGMVRDDNYSHEGYVGQVFEDGSLHGGGPVIEAANRTIAFRAACACGWRGVCLETRERGTSAWREWEEVPRLLVEWDSHLDSAGVGQTASRDDEPRLGLATNYALLSELATRFEMSKYGTPHEDLDHLAGYVRGIRDALSQTVREYRTVDHA